MARLIRICAAINGGLLVYNVLAGNAPSLAAFNAFCLIFCVTYRQS